MSNYNECIQSLDKIPTDRWAKIYCSLNKYEWPEDLPGKPDWWVDDNGSDMKHEFVMPVMLRIVNAIGKKACNREWNRASMTDEQHEKFYKETYPHG